MTEAEMDEMIIAVGRQMRIEGIWFERAEGMRKCEVRGEARLLTGACWFGSAIAGEIVVAR